MNVSYWLLINELERMSKYLELLKNTVQLRYEDLEESYEKDMAREMDEDEAAILQDVYTDDFIEAAESLPQLLLSSFIISWYSFVEQKLIDLCDDLHLSVRITPKDNKSMGKGIRRARTFLIEGANYEIDKVHWQELLDVNKLRNVIVHEGKDLTTTYSKPDGQPISFTTDSNTPIYILADDGLVHYLNKHNLIKRFDTLFEILPSFEYCEYLIKLSEKLFSKLYTDLKMS
jgi:hypothetical protein